MDPKNQVQLITYPDSLGGNLRALRDVLKKHFYDLFKGGIHILPPFPSSGDRGFAPLTYLEIEREFGTWEDIRALGRDYDIILDLMVNHISRQSAYFSDFLKKGKKSEYADLFIPLEKIWHDGKPVQKDIDKMFLRRPVPYSGFTIEETGEAVTVWTTFGRQTPSEQIDIDVHSEIAKKLVLEFLKNFSLNNIKMVRLDAVGYVIKKPGTSCFFVEPEMYEYLEWIKTLAHSFDLELLPEVHAHYTTQCKLVEHGFWIYDFILPYMVLDTLVNRNSVKLARYLRTRPHKQFTMLDCHDGIPVKPDMDDLATTSGARKIVDMCVERGANLSLVFSGVHKDKDGFDVHQIRCSYYSALNCDDDAWLAARAIQFFAPGIPQVYYTGLLAGKNDVEKVMQTGEGREINRHNYSLDEIDEAVTKDVVKRLFKLIRFRNEHPAFSGKFTVQDSPPDEIALLWQKDMFECRLRINLNTYRSTISYTNDVSEIVEYIV
jgi:sucrose phosphorylase